MVLSVRRNAFLYPKQFDGVDRCFSLAGGEVGPVDAVDDGLFPVGHHDRVAEDKLNRCLGFDREVWTAMAAVSMHAEEDDPGVGAWN